MRQKNRQTAVILLSLLLVLLPMQSTFAGILSLDQSDEAISHSMMDMDHETSMSCCEGHVDCTANNSCDANECSSGHCATCVAGILGDSKVSPIISIQEKYFSLNYSIVSKPLSSLYRPPRT